LTEAGVKRTRIGGCGNAETVNFSHAVPAGTVFGAKCVGAGSFGFSLVSCAVAPGFDFADWRMDSADDMRKRFKGPEAQAAISELAKDVGK
jgi:hypothetical protein